MCKPVDWRSSTAAPTLARGAIHVWRLSLIPPPQWRLAQFRGWLSRDEQERMGRFLAPDAARRFLVARAGLRSILARYLEVAPGSLVFAYGHQGKPDLGTPRSALHFNLSHSGDLALLAVAVDQPLGVDLEQVRPRDNLLAIARRMFPGEQYRKLQRLQGACQLEAFFRSWTAIEAQAKARGRSIFEHVRDLAPTTWELKHLVPAPAYLAAVAAQRLPTHPGSWSYLDPGWDDPA